MTVPEQREEMIATLARIETILKQNDKDHSETILLLKEQNGRVRKNTNKISWIMGVGTAVGAALAFIVTLLKFT